MLTNYFSFNTPGSKEEVVATSDKFALNSQAALAFYSEDETVGSTYKRLYLIGRENARNVSTKNAESVTGGSAQRNPVDYIELVAASAAYDFYQTSKAHLVKPIFPKKAEIYSRTMVSDEEGCLTFGSFFGEDKDKFAQKCGIMMASAYLFGPQDFATNRRKHPSFKALTEENVKDIRDFFSMFYDLDGINKDEPESGWIKQMQVSAMDDLGYKGFLFNQAAFSTTPGTAAKFKYNEKMFPESSQYRYNVNLISSAFDTFKKEFGDEVFGDSDKTAVSKLLKRTYDTFTKLYGF
jgi:hypothetical protein